ncbi:hypothetical protein X801_05844, partial [Opisthorchis viverrini]
MTSRVFGAVSSPFCTNFALRQTASVFGRDYDDRTKRSVTNNYVPVPSVTDAKRFVQGIADILPEAGFTFISGPGEPLTRREITAAFCSLFYPLGVISPVYLTAEEPLQELCKTGPGWDSPVSEDHSIRYHSWLN